MIALKSSTNFAWEWANAKDEQQAEAIFSRTYPSLYGHMKLYEQWEEPETRQLAGLRHREDQGRFWWELRSSKYYGVFDSGFVAYQDIAFNSAFEQRIDVFPEMTAFCLPSVCPALLSILNSSMMWYYMSRAMLHGKDEALRLKTDKMQIIPISTKLREKQLDLCASYTQTIIERTKRTKLLDATVLDWLRHEFGLEKPSAAFSGLHDFDADGFAGAVRKALPKSRKLTAADIARLKQEHAATVEPARRVAQEALALERRLSDLVNAAYGLTPEDVALMWATAPPRMPFPPDHP
jgi:hypothetical protein